jgi:hypothetical protein
VSDHYHHASEIQGAADDRHGHPGLERDISSVESDLRNHRHYDLETDDKTAQQAITCLRAELNELREDLEEALGRIRDLERLRPTCTVCLDATATQQTVHGPACSGCVGEPPEAEVDHHPYGQGQEPGPEPEEYDPGPEADDEGGMSEYRYVLPEDYERGQS